jgi:cytochrome c-type biogenesis protein CcmF
VFPLLMAPALFLMGIGPLARWKQANLPEIAVRLKWALGVSVVTALLLPLALGRWSWLAAAGLWLALWISAATAVNLWSRLRPLAGSGLGARFSSLPLGYLGMLTAHVGVATFIVGVTLVKTYETEKDVQMDIGDTVTVGPYTFQFGGVSSGTRENYLYSRGPFQVSRNGHIVETMYAEKRQFVSQPEASTVAAIDLMRDLYISLGEPAGSNTSAWIVRVYYKPFVHWVWGGCLVMALGGALALSDRRYRLARRAGQEAIDGTLSGTVPA